MGSLISENLHARERVVDKLLKGKEIAIRLQTLLNDPIQVHGLVSVQELASEILGSFTESLSELSSCSDSAESIQMAAVDGRSASACSGESKKRPAGAKDRRGCYKRRSTSDSWVKVSSTPEDNFAWRKYGQKSILKSEYPRCYYRCSHKYEGCKAIKQVQRIKDEPILYQTTYFNHHTCTDTIRAPLLIVDNDDDHSDPVEPTNLLSFQLNHHHPNHFEQQNNSSSPMINVSNPLKKEEESKEDTQNTEDLSDAKSSVLLDPWQDIVTGSSEQFGYKPVWTPMIGSYQEVGSENCGSTSLHGFDFEVNQLDDIDSFQFGEMY